MDLVLSKIFIPTEDKNRALRFFTFLFDCEILEDDQGHEYTKLGSTPIYFEERPITPTHLAFKVAPDFDLQDITNKIEFFCYRENLVMPSFELHEGMLSMQDFDGNTWQFESSNMSFQQLSKESNIDNVRNC
jgi:hypothetical protein